MHAYSVPGALLSTEDSAMIQTHDIRPEGAYPPTGGHLRPGPLTPQTGPQPYTW